MKMEAMQGGVRRRRSRLLLVVLVVAFTIDEEALAAKHVVGGSQGWDVSVDLGAWVSSDTFRVGDQLVFKYTSGLHSVVELAGEKEYDKCDMGGALDSMNGGTSTVKLDKPGHRYFTCGTLGHCDQGMKVKIKTLAASEAASQDPPSSSASSPSIVYSHVSFLAEVAPAMFLGLL